MIRITPKLETFQIPQQVNYDSKFSCVVTAKDAHPSVTFTNSGHNEPMKRERILFLRQMKRWLKGYGNNWIRGASIVQAVTNTLSLE
jgi:hypothetical protein